MAWLNKGKIMKENKINNIVDIIMPIIFSIFLIFMLSITIKPLGRNHSDDLMNLYVKKDFAYNNILNHDLKTDVDTLDRLRDICHLESNDKIYVDKLFKGLCSTIETNDTFDQSYYYDLINTVAGINHDVYQVKIYDEITKTLNKNINGKYKSDFSKIQSNYKMTQLKSAISRLVKFVNTHPDYKLYFLVAGSYICHDFAMYGEAQRSLCQNIENFEEEKKSIEEIISFYETVTLNLPM